MNSNPETEADGVGRRNSIASSISFSEGIGLGDIYHHCHELDTIFQDVNKVYYEPFRYGIPVERTFANMYGYFESNHICQVNGRHNLSILPTYSRAISEALYNDAIPSKVGKSSETVLDETIRKSREYSGDQLEWSQDFLDYVSTEAEGALQKFNARLVSITPHKLVLYERDDFFKEHTDAIHALGQSMTAVVKLCGSIKINGVNYGSKTPHFILFYHDMPHEVEKVSCDDFNISITFDVVADPIDKKLCSSMISTTMADVNICDMLIKRMRNLGVVRFGFFATRQYLGNQPLKGDDARFVELLGSLASHVATMDLCRSEGSVDEEDGHQWYRQEVWQLINSGVFRLENILGQCEGLYSNTPPAKTDFPSVWEPQTPNSIVKDEYCIGDVFLLWSPHYAQVLYEGNDEVYFGNEGFDGVVHKNTFLLFSLHQNSEEERLGQQLKKRKVP